MEGLKLKFFFSTFSLFLLVQFCYTEGISKDGFSVDLIPRDSPLSPFYDPSVSRFDGLQKAFRRSVARASENFGTNAIQSSIIANRGSYLMNISLGTPAVSFFGIADTGSDLIWRQCLPCQDCYKQVEPLFDPKKSNTYRVLSCDETACGYLGDRGTCGAQETCNYAYSYGDRSHTNGDLATDTLTIGTAKVPEVIFGCGYDNAGTFDENDSGLIGLGGGPLSLISQLSSLIGGRFSYCLVPFGTDTRIASKLRFGPEGVVSGAGAVSTPIVDKDPATYFYLTLESLSVGSKNLAYKGFSKSPLADADEGNIIIDSGTTLTLLPQDFYSTLESNVAEAIGGDTVPDPNNVFGLCYSSLDGLKIPTITAHFSGADVQLQPLNTFVQVEEDLFCFSMIPTPSSIGLAIFGNLAQMNFLVGYNLNTKKVTFKPTDCTKN